jgi:uncharacterized protein (TIGR02266 family)
MSTSVDQLETQLAGEEAQLKVKLDSALGHWRELSGRVRALQQQLEQATSLGMSVGPLGDRVRAMTMPVLESGAASQRAEALRREAVSARRAALAELTARLPGFEAELQRLAAHVAAEEGAVAEQVDSARAIARQVADAAKKLESPVEDAMRIGRMSGPKRVQPRVRMQVKIDVSSDNNFFSGFSTNISDGGVFIATVKIVPIGTPMDLYFRLPNGEGVEAKGVVRWVRDVDDLMPEIPPGIGVQFVDLSDKAREAVTAFVRSREPMFYPD